jgi:predicted DNA-binding antitoxin AbrB/MazE fold protein
MKIRTKAVYENGTLKPKNDPKLMTGEEVKIEIVDSVRRTRGIIKLDPAIAKVKDIADSEKWPFLEE